MNFAAMMKQAQQVQGKMQELQTRLAATECEGGAGGGAVKITLTGRGNATSVKIDSSVVNASEVEMLEDLIAAAINDAVAKKEALAQAETQKVMGGLNLPPGLNLPF